MIYLGTAGFSYPDWKGHFYPERCDNRHMLEFYSARFPVVEINSTWYAIPPPSRFNSMAERTPPEFRFIVKAFRGITHDLPGQEADFRAFLASIRPLADHGKLCAILAQFPWGFKNTPENRDYLRVLRERMDDQVVMVEFRNQGWIEDGVAGLLEELGLGFCCVDEPRLQGLVKPEVIATGNTGYVRFHGRNHEAWWDRKREAWERYNYLYSEEELGEWVPGALELAKRTTDAYLIFNNHYRGQAVRNARMMAQLLPPELVVPLAPEETGPALF